MLQLLGWILLASFVSAFVPLVNIEAVLAVAAGQDAADSTVMLVLLATMATVGMVAGKLLFYLAARESLRLRWLAERLERPKTQASLAKWRERTERYPQWTTLLMLVSSFTGFPPYAVMVVLAGVLKVRMSIFLITGVVGRFARFWLILTAAQWIWFAN